VVDAGGAVLAPGFIDLHVHGVGESLVENGPDEVEAVSS
jgi:N-acetylglucosamine-6-phosphate deacetylase